MMFIHHNASSIFESSVGVKRSLPAAWRRRWGNCVGLTCTGFRPFKGKNSVRCDLSEAIRPALRFICMLYYTCKGDISMQNTLRTLGPKEATVVLSLTEQGRNVVRAGDVIDLLGSESRRAK